MTNSPSMLSQATAQALTTIEADPTFFEDDGYASSIHSGSSMSVSSSVRDYAFENGRRYHKFREGQYVFPNDKSEQDREDMKHSMIINLCGGKLHFAPIGEHPQRILDLGTGTGIWCIDMGDEYPSAQILGIDLSPIQPVWVPPNVKFMVDDAESEWMGPENVYDFVHSRHVTPAFKDFPTLILRAYRYIRPGGWIEFQEMHHPPHCDDSSMPSTYPLLNYFRLVNQGLVNLGIKLDNSISEVSSLQKFGFTQISHIMLKVPIGTWPKNKKLKTVGLYAKAGILDGLEAMAFGPICRGLGWSKEQVEVVIVDVRRSLEDQSVHAYLPFHVWYGQKPLKNVS